MKHAIKTVSIIALAASLGACGGMTPQEQNTALGAAAGGVIGNVISGGSAVGTIGGAAAGGIIGHELSEDRDARRGRYNRY